VSIFIQPRLREGDFKICLGIKWHWPTHAHRESESVCCGVASVAIKITVLDKQKMLLVIAIVNS
jgi:hypothetical protein